MKYQATYIMMPLKLGQFSPLSSQYKWDIREIWDVFCGYHEVEIWDVVCGYHEVEIWDVFCGIKVWFMFCCWELYAISCYDLPHHNTTKLYLFMLWMLQSWWYHEMELLSTLMALCEGKPLVNSSSSMQNASIQKWSFSLFILNKWSNK